MYTLPRAQLESDLPKFQERLFYTKDAALASGVVGEVCIGSPAIHSVCEIVNRVVNRETGETVKVLNFIWHRTYWG